MANMTQIHEQTTSLRTTTNIAFFSGTEISPNLNHYTNILAENQPWTCNTTIKVQTQVHNIIACLLNAG
uniref:Coenzyme Q3, methyltransferase n=1 Tax=Aegilops tauschii subsp. strangulata TaxID=200361 RepID=A0A453QQ30_AEGTS